MTRLRAYPDGLLYPDELELIERLANGDTVAAIERGMGLDRAELASLERDVRAKLQATTSAHLIARAFQLGVLRLLCLVLLCLSVNIGADKPFRQRMPTRAPTKTVNIRAHRAAGGRDYA